jgi:hypothetical protein
MSSLADPTTVVTIVNQGAWLVPMFTFLAGVAGAGITGFFLTRNEKAKLKAARSDKMGDLSREAAANYLAEIDKNMNILMHPAHDPDDPELELQLHRTLKAIALVCSEDVIDASTSLVRAFNKLSYSHKQLDRKGFVAAYHSEFRDARDAFVNAVRKEQGLPALPKEITQRPLESG